MSGDVAVWLHIAGQFGGSTINLGHQSIPVPLLDGGHLVFYAAEAATGKPLNVRAQEWGLKVGLALVLSLMLFCDLE